jgi:hypothetical protein
LTGILETETHQRWHGLPSSHVIWLLLQYKQAWLTFLLFEDFFFFPPSSFWVEDGGVLAGRSLVLLGVESGAAPLFCAKSA